MSGKGGGATIAKLPSLWSHSTACAIVPLKPNELTPHAPASLAALDPPLSKASAEVIDLGRTKYARYCAVCHAPGAVGSTELPDLRRSGALENRTAWLQIVHGGALSDNGMASFAPSLSKDEVEAIRQYVIKRANEDKAMEAERAKTRITRR